MTECYCRIGTRHLDYWRCDDTQYTSALQAWSRSPFSDDSAAEALAIPVATRGHYTLLGGDLDVLCAPRHHYSGTGSTVSRMGTSVQLCGGADCTGWSIGVQLIANTCPRMNCNLNNSLGELFGRPLFVNRQEAGPVRLHPRQDRPFVEGETTSRGRPVSSCDHTSGLGG